MPERLQKAEHTLVERAVRKQGKPRLTERAQVNEQIEAILKQFRMEGILHVQVQEEESEQPVRAYWGRLSPPRQHWSFQVSVERETTAIDQAMSQFGWKVHATNQMNESDGQFPWTPTSRRSVSR